MPEERKLEEHLLSQAAENTLSNQLDEAEIIDVDVQTDLLKIIQGKVDSISLAGEGLEIKDIRIQEIQLKTDSITVNPLSAIVGQIELEQPVNTVARLVVTEADINNAFKSNEIRSKIQKFDLNVDNEIVSFQLQQIQIFLSDEGKIQFHGTVLLKEKSDTRQISFTAMLSPQTKHHPILLESFHCTQGGGISLNIVVPLINKAKELINQPYFEFEETKFRLINLEVQKSKLIILVEAMMKKIPKL